MCELRELRRNQTFDLFCLNTQSAALLHGAFSTGLYERGENHSVSLLLACDFDASCHEHVNQAMTVFGQFYRSIQIVLTASKQACERIHWQDGHLQRFLLAHLESVKNPGLQDEKSRTSFH